ncbi:MAG: hypothetical protein LUC99_10265 [Clostridiales bacterium]|nr:hypothetical protein [Clostridiales bacterium]
MISIYEEYLTKEKSLNFEGMAALHHEIVSEVGNDPDALELYDELVCAATRYSGIRAQWFLWNREERMDKDSDRTSCHNSLIVKCNQLARYLKMQGKPADWRDALGYEEDDKYNRKRIGDFGCYIAFINAINAR